MLSEERVVGRIFHADAGVDEDSLGRRHRRLDFEVKLADLCTALDHRPSGSDRGTGDGAAGERLDLVEQLVTP